MKPIFIDLHIHTSKNPDKLNEFYNLDLLKEKIEGIAEDSDYLISLTDHNTINKPVYLEAVDKFKNILLGVELHIRNHDYEKPYHSHIYFDLDPIEASDINNINAILDELYPKKEVADVDEIPKLEEILNRFDSYDFVLLPHGGQSHSTFNESIPKGAQFDNTLERNIYYNHFDGFTARSEARLEGAIDYLGILGVNEFVNLITASDNYSPKEYPKGKANDAKPFVRTWMLASPTFNGLRLSLSESSRLKYGPKPDLYSENIGHVSLKNGNIDIDVELTPGLNVVIGGSSSGKTLFVDSIYRKIVGNFNDDCNYLSYGVEDIQVVNLSGQEPYYLEQSYISKVCDHKDKENTIDSIDILKRVFPSDTEESRRITKGLSNLNSQLASLVQSVKEIESTQDALSRIPVLSHLITLDIPQDNPLKYIMPKDKLIETIDYEEVDLDADVEKLDEIDKFLSKNPLVEHDKELVKKLKEELKLAFDYSELEYAVREIIISHRDEVDEAKEAEDQKETIRRKQFDELRECIWSCPRKLVHI